MEVKIYRFLIKERIIFTQQQSSIRDHLHFKEKQIPSFYHLTNDHLADKDSLGALSGMVNLLILSIVDQYFQLCVCQPVNN